ncbi:MAG: LysM peptidoglycan-binding domain-containing protein, partial [Gemmatimonadetes bacterium]|nr:LysM peptidoglycan-binding domain-containing protein [Gemmatimonadota bacterium]
EKADVELSPAAAGAATDSVTTVASARASSEGDAPVGASLQAITNAPSTGIQPVTAFAIELPPVPPPRLRRVTRTLEYRVRAGETLYRIAANHGVTVAEMERWNPAARTRITPGMRLTIHPSSTAGAADGAGLESRNVAAASSGEPQASDPGNARVVHRVAWGDTLWSISRRHGVTPRQVQDWNGLRDASIRVGQRLVLFPRDP